MSGHARRLIARLSGDARGVTIVEFALIAPALLMILLGVFDIGFNMYVTSVLDGATQKAGRDSTIEGAETQGLAIDDSVREAVHRVIPGATLSFDRRSYRDYSDVHQPEDFSDIDGDGECDNGEPFEDVNGNDTWDSDRGADGMGGARDAVLYTVDVSYPRVFPLMRLLGFPPIVTNQTQTVLRNQPYGNQATSTTIGHCT